MGKRVSEGRVVVVRFVTCWGSKNKEVTMLWGFEVGVGWVLCKIKAVGLKQPQPPPPATPQPWLTRRPHKLTTKSPRQSPNNQ